MSQGIVTDSTVTAFPRAKVWVRTARSVTARQLNFNSLFRAARSSTFLSSSSRSAPLRISRPMPKTQRPQSFPHFVSTAGTCWVGQGIFYNGPTPPSCMPDNLTNILPISSDLWTRSYSDMILSADANSTAGSRSVRFRTYRSACSLILFDPL